jgi:hypothetical protein
MYHPNPVSLGVLAWQGVESLLIQRNRGFSKAEIRQASQANSADRFTAKQQAIRALILFIRL